MTDALANMTLVAMTAESKKENADKRAKEWYEYYQRKTEEFNELQTALAAEIKGHEATRIQLEEAIATVDKLSAELKRLKDTRGKTEALKE